MKKLIVLLLIFAGASATVPSLRERVEPRVVPVWDFAYQKVRPLIRKVLDPVLRWSAVKEARSIGRDLRRREMSLQPLPGPREFPRWVAQTQQTGRGGLDPWGSPYYLIVGRDSLFVGSPGPDKERDTEDDVRVGTSRR